MKAGKMTTNINN